MAEFVFTSPGVKFKERDLTFVTRNVGITTLGLVGETLKGPAFEPIFIQDKGQFTTRFGGQSIKKFADGSLQYQLPYVANAYLEETNQLWVTRVLGLSGYDAGTAWMITLDAGIDLSTTGTTGSPVITTGITFTDYAYLGVAITANGQTGSYASGYTKQVGGTFIQYLHEFTATTYNAGSGTVTDKVTQYTGASYTEYEDMVLAVIRSNGLSTISTNEAQNTEFYATNLEIDNNLTLIPTGDLYGKFNLIASDSGSTETYTVSLDPTDPSFLPNVIGRNAKEKKSKIWTQAVYPDLIKKLDSLNIGYGINSTLISGTSENFTDYKTEFKTPETPWVVSQIKGSGIDRLFKFISISDGDAANEEIKISITNINPTTFEFDVVIRDFYDTDDNPTVLESYSRCTMIKGLNSYIGQRIGTSDGEYNLSSNYVMVEIADEIAPNVFPAGFEGYYFNDYSASATTGVGGIAPKIFYKTSYTTLEAGKPNKTYLGISEKGYTGDGINQNMFNYLGEDGFVKTKGFHLDSGVTGNVYYDGTVYIGEFEGGAGKIQTYRDTDDVTNPYNNIRTRKFTFVPAGGFDGWDIHRISRSNTNGYQQGGIFSGYPNQPNIVPKNDYQAWQTAIDTFSNPEQVTINLFATPGIDWMNHTSLVQDTIEMIEEKRTDSLYITDSPNFDIDSNVIGETRNADVDVAKQIADALEDTGIDSSYSCTYAPWIQIRDTQNNVNIYIPPTGEVVRAMAFTDNIKFPWFAPAGLTRGVTNAIKSRFKLSLEARDILYAGRINPLADFADAGTAIFGQKTLQKRESALDRINVRRLLLQIKVLIANIAIRLVFEQNDQATIDQFLAKANPILASIKSDRGLQDFRIKMDDTNNTPESRDRNELYGEIFLKPTRAVEYIGITFTITPSGASFEE